MKKISVLPVLVLSIVLTSSGLAQLPGSLTNGLVAYYPFTGSANDQTGGGYDGTVVGAQLVMDRFMTPLSAYYFNGSSDYIFTTTQLPDSAGLTISAWIQPATLKYAGIFYDSALSTPGFDTIFQTRPDGSLFAAMDKIESPKPGYLQSTPVLTAGNWAHVVATTEVSGMAIYLNGVSVASQPSGSHNIGYHSEMYIGAENHGFYPEYFFHGAIDDVAVYTRALSATEVTDLYNAQSVPEPSTYALLLLSGAASLWALKRRKSKTTSKASLTKSTKQKAASFC